VARLYEHGNELQVQQRVGSFLTRWRNPCSSV